MVSVPPLLFVAYGLVALGLVLAAVCAGTVLRRVINIEAFTVQIVKLVRARNMERAVKLCNAAPEAWFVRMVKPALAAGLNEEAGSLRQAAAMRGAYQKAREQVLASIRAGQPLMLAAALAAAAGTSLAGYAGAAGAFSVGFVGVGLTALLLVWCARSSQQLRVQADPAAERILAAVRTRER